MLFEFLCIALLICVLDYLWRRKTNAKLARIPGPPSLPLIGGAWIYFNSNPNDLLSMATKFQSKYGTTMCAWIVHMPGCITSDLKVIQAVLSHPTEIKKNRIYALLAAWLGNGLLMSEGKKWLNRRRAITPTFHFQILEDFIGIFDKQACILTQKLAEKADAKTAFDVQHYIALATLDVICETAMGVRIHAQTDAQCAYVHLLSELTQIILKRLAKIPFRVDLIYKLCAPQLAKREHELRQAMHGFTERIIMERRAKMLAEPKRSNEDEKEFGIKTRMALLDVLLSTEIDGEPLSNADIREEVDTFMFEGHDTTKSAIAYALYNISREPQVQQKLYDEIKQVLGSARDANVPLKYTQLMELKYMEKVIKETLRMYPPVPFIGRQMQQDLHVGEICLPKGTSVLLNLYSMQNDEQHFPEAARFIPEREANENVYALVPFSAGPRNCIGQRFAMLEIKTFLARILQCYELLPLGLAVEPAVYLVLKSHTGWQLGFRKR